MIEKTCDVNTNEVNAALRILLDTLTVVDNIWKEITEANISDAMKLLTEFLIKLESLINCITMINDKLKYRVDVNIIFDYMSDMERSIKIGDYILLSDLLEYEIKPLLKRWDKSLNRNI